MSTMLAHWVGQQAHGWCKPHDAIQLSLTDRLDETCFPDFFAVIWPDMQFLVDYGVVGCDSVVTVSQINHGTTLPFYMVF